MSELSDRVEDTCRWLESGSSVLTRDMAHDIRARIAELEAERCQTCTSYKPWTATGSPDFCCCSNEVMDGVMDDEGHNPPADFGCSRWQ